ncbi:protein involved in polysaccharide export with SLBB domain [Rheinheimera pacifica]|uniref:SLBB domain-containing protein n=1 Tax=Rheinheimera pacifica TaxID=173990 RepID=UPI00216833D9|nr:SLBB domain-containing protein [Rheinheimera pacifica]MCS4308824.1 protein involved in polysaccharide export with SLBB domain [Rheinheimera pacifica]
MLKFVQFACLAIGLSIGCIGSVAAQSATPSPAMIEQFQKLPRAEQERLARQYGYNLPSSSRSNSNNNSSGASNEIQQQEFLQPQLPEPENDDDDSKEAKRFGLKLFNSNASTFAALTNVPVPDTYILGPDDSLLLQLYGKENLEYDLRIGRDGSLNIPEIGPVTLAGLSFNQARSLIAERVRSAKIGVEAAVSMGQMRTINVVIAGEAKRPGIYAVSALTTVTQALFVAGGVSDIGSLRNIRVNRAGKNISQFDLYQLLLKGNAVNDINLQHGDVVFVAPVTAMAEVKGEVQRPAIYELTADDTLQNLLQMAGGTKAGAYPKNAVLERFNSNNLRDLRNLDLTQRSAQQITAQNGDVLQISATSPRIENVVTVAGAVVRPGQFAWQQGMQVTDLLPSLWSGLHMVADLDYALIVREINNAGDIDVLQFNIGKAITEPGSSDNLQLQPRDRILVFPHGGSSYNREALYAELKKKTEVSNIKPEAALLKKTNYGYVTAEQEEQIGYHLSQLIGNIYKDAALLPLSAYFTRRELLTPVLQKISQQARHNQQPKLVSVSGNVKVAGTYPLTQQATVSDLIIAAGGLAQSAFVSRAELTRAMVTDNLSIEAQHIAINLNEVFSGTNNVVLQSRDSLNVFETPDWDVNRSITLRGEVRFPGVYSIQQHESLEDVIKRAGGLTEHAFIQGAVFTRTGVQQQETEQQKKLIEQLRADIAGRALSAQGSPTAPADVITMIAELEKQKPVGRLVIDLEGVISGNPLHHIQVQNGDQLIIPRRNHTISILGEVQHASSHRFDPKRSLDDYLKLAGGMRKRADEERVYVIRADGSVLVPENNWFAVSSSRLQPGDTIIVPLDTEYKDNLTLWAQITQIFYQSAVAIAALNSF